jgi:aldose 1-epimerase
MIQSEIFGYLGEKEIRKYTMINSNGMKVSCISYGAKLTEIIVPDKQGNLSNVLLGFDNLDSYLKDRSMFLGAAIGRVGGRIAKGEFQIKGTLYKVPVNEGENTLHGGENGFDTLIWNSDIVESENYTSIIFYRTIAPEEDGFPGNLQVKIIYTLKDNNEVLITFKGVSDDFTLFNPTIHSYFNLNNDFSKLLSGHTLQINASNYAELAAELVPTGKLNDVSKTPLDFRQPKDLPQAIKQVKEHFRINGIDHPFKVDNNENIATLINHETGRRLDIESNRNGLVVYTLNVVDKIWNVQNKKVIPEFGVALEAQTLPDSIHHENFGDTILSPNKQEEYYIKYKFTIV